METWVTISVNGTWKWVCVSPPLPFHDDDDDDNDDDDDDAADDDDDDADDDDDDDDDTLRDWRSLLLFPVFPFQVVRKNHGQPT